MSLHFSSGVLHFAWNFGYETCMCPGKVRALIQQNALVMNAQQILANRSLRSEFSSLKTATGYINRCHQPSKWATVLGDNRMYWVLSNRDASVLVKAGYEYAA